MLRFGAALLQQLLATDTGHRGPRIDCGAGHHAQVRRLPRQEPRHRVGPGRGAPRLLPLPHLPARDRALATTISASPMPRCRRDCAAWPRAPRPPYRSPPPPTCSPNWPESGCRTKRIERSAETDGAAAAARISTESTAIARRQVSVLPGPATTGDGKPPDKLYIAIDGTGVPMVPAAVTGRAAKSGDGRARTREVKLACLFTQTTRRRGGPARARPGLDQLPGQLRPRRAVRHPGARRGPPPRSPTTSANSSCSATAHPGSGPWPPRSCPKPPRSWTSTTPANTCTTWPPRSPACSATSTRTRWPPACPTSTPATSKPSSPRPTASHPPATPPT